MTDYFEDKLASFEKALKTFEEALVLNPSTLERDGAIQRFEYCYDLAWKTVKRYLERQGLFDLNSPKAVFEQAYLNKLILDEQIWLDIIQHRNLSVHTYNEKLAESLFRKLPPYFQAMKLLKESLKLNL